MESIDSLKKELKPEDEDDKEKEIKSIREELEKLKDEE